MAWFYLSIALFFHTSWLPLWVEAKDVIDRNENRSDVKGGGGDSRCLDFSAQLVKVSWQIASAATNPGFIKTLPNINFKTFTQTANTNKCDIQDTLPLNRQAWSYPETNRTLIRVPKEGTGADFLYENLVKEAKTALVVHELLVLENLERDGQFQLTERILNALKKFSREFIVESIHAKSTIWNKDGTITFMYPKIEIKNNLHAITLLFNKDGSLDTKYNAAYCKALWLDPVPGAAPGGRFEETFDDIVALERDTGRVLRATYGQADPFPNDKIRAEYRTIASIICK